MASITDIYNLLEQNAPKILAQSWDNVGLLVKTNTVDIKNVLVALDITPEVVKEAQELNCQLVVSHHPVIFSGLKTLSDTDVCAQLYLKGISAICMHTNLDAANGGVNDVLANMLNITQTEVFAEGCGRIGSVEPITAEDLAKLCKDKFGAGVRCAKADKIIKRLAVVGGSGGGCFEEALNLGADALVTGEAGHHHALDAKRLGITLIAAGHHATEAPILPVLAEQIASAFTQVNTFVSKTDKDPFTYL